MRDLNVDFMDLYKRVDRFLRDAYASKEGIKDYLSQMEQHDARGRQYVASWKADYCQLQHLRKLRNLLSHEIAFDSELCREEDFLWLEAFYSRLYATADPLALLYKAENTERRRQAEAQQRQKQSFVQPIPAAAQPRPCPPKLERLWQKVKRFFTKRIQT